MKSAMKILRKLVNKKVTFKQCVILSLLIAVIGSNADNESLQSAKNNQSKAVSKIVETADFDKANDSEVGATVSCKFDHAYIAAHYDITKKTQSVKEQHHNHQHDGDGHDSQGNESDAQTTEKLILWRNNREVAQQSLDSQLTNYWYQLANRQIKSVKFFDGYKKAIEYSPSDVQFEQGPSAWQAKSQIITDDLIAKMQLTSKQGSGCFRVEHYKKSTASQEMNLVWLPELKLIRSLSISNKNVNSVWQLDRIETSKQLVINQFKTWQDYSMTDFADIGDNESDPFLQKMINMGFIEHSH
jgi:hypothetical protein